MEEKRRSGSSSWRRRRGLLLVVVLVVVLWLWRVHLGGGGEEREGEGNLLLVAEHVELRADGRSMRLRNVRVRPHESCGTSGTSGLCFRVDGFGALQEEAKRPGNLFVALSGGPLVSSELGSRSALFLIDKLEWALNPYHEFNNNALPIFGILLDLLAGSQAQGSQSGVDDMESEGRKSRGYVALLSRYQNRKLRKRGLLTLGLPLALETPLISDLDDFVRVRSFFDVVQITIGTPSEASLSSGCTEPAMSKTCGTNGRLVGEVEFDPAVARMAQLFVKGIVDGISGGEDHTNPTDQEKIFLIIVRTNYRRFVNLEELKSHARGPRGWKIVFLDLDMLSFEGIVRHFSHAHVAAGLHGAGLINCAFLRKGPSVCMQILTWRMESDFHVRREFQKLSNAVGIRYLEWPCLRFEDTRYPDNVTSLLDTFVPTFIRKKTGKIYQARPSNELLRDRDSKIEFGSSSYELMNADLFMSLETFDKMIEKGIQTYNGQ